MPPPYGAAERTVSVRPWRFASAFYTLVDFFYLSTYSPAKPAAKGAGMALNIKNSQVEELAAEIAEITGESKTEAIRRALEERRQRLSFQVAHESRGDELRSFLEREVWSVIRARSASRRLATR
jgi:antitoxin VapB